jgi:resuscitation-promoting factor RpfB
MFTAHQKYIRISLGIMLVVFGLVLVGMRKTVELSVNGQLETVDTWAITVGQLLDQQKINVGEKDHIEPSPGSYLAHDARVTVSQASTIQIEVDGKEFVFQALDPIPANLFAQVGVSISPADVLRTEYGPIPVKSVFKTHNDTHFWQVERALPFTLQHQSGIETYASTAPTVGQALWEAGIRLTNADRINPPLNTELIPDMEITILSGREIVIQTEEAEYRLHTSAETVSEALVNAGLLLQGLDYTMPAENEPLPENGIIKLVRVTEDILIEQTLVPFETTYQAVEDLEIDRQTVLEAGEYGINAQRIRVRFENDQEVSRQVEEEWLAAPPKDRVIGYGTQIVMRSIDTADGTVDYWRAVTLYAVSYKPADTGGNITSTGQVLKKGIIAVNPNYIPYGTVLYVPGYGFGVAADTGRLSARMIDLGYTDEDYVSWHHNVTVYFVWPPPANIVYIIP